MTNTKTKSYLGKKEVISSYISTLQSKEVRAETRRQQLKQKPQRYVVSWLALCDFLSLFPYSFQDHQPQGSTAHSVNWTLIINQENTPGLAHRPLSWRCFLNRDSLFPDDSGLCQVDIKLVRYSTGVTPSTVIKEELLHIYVSV